LEHKLYVFVGASRWRSSRKGRKIIRHAL
jgi:hypothetical protein